MAPSDHGYPRERAEFYHARMADVDRGDVGYYVDRALEADGPVLEMACGTGRVYLPMLRAGVDADGFDLSAGALAVLRENAADAGLDPSVRRADMADFAVEREYALVVCPANALQHLLAVDAQLAALRSAYGALAPGGRFVFDVFVPDFDHICGEYGEWRTETVDYRGALYEYRTRSRIADGVEQSIAVQNELYGPDGDRVFSEEHRMKLLPKREVELLARLSPFADPCATGDFTDAPVADGDSVQVWTLRKGE